MISQRNFVMLNYSENSVIIPKMTIVIYFLILKLKVR